MKFKNDDARKKHCIKKGLEIQRDDEGRDGIAVSKAGDADTKEIRVGKRLSATKVKSMKYAEDVDKNELAMLQISRSTPIPRTDGNDNVTM